MDLRVPDEQSHDETPDPDEEDGDHDDDGPGGDLDVAPEVGPVSTAGRGEGEDDVSDGLLGGKRRVLLTKVHSASSFAGLRQPRTTAPVSFGTGS